VQHALVYRDSGVIVS